MKGGHRLLSLAASSANVSTAAACRADNCPLLITGDEEGAGGQRQPSKMLGWALGPKATTSTPHWSANRHRRGGLGDTMKIGRRGKPCRASLTITRPAGAIPAYPDPGRQSDARALVRALAALTALENRHRHGGFSSRPILQITAVRHRQTPPPMSSPAASRARFNVRFQRRPAATGGAGADHPKRSPNRAPRKRRNRLGRAGGPKRFVTGEGALSQSLSEAIGDQTGLQAQTFRPAAARRTRPLLQGRLSGGPSGGLVGAYHAPGRRNAWQWPDLAILTSIYAGFSQSFFFEESKP